jgi:hypothetical protein
LPPNHLDRYDLSKLSLGLTEDQFNQVIDQVSAFYAPVIKAHGAKFYVNRRWNDSTVNASAEQSGSRWEVNMYGGLARRPEITQDAFVLVMCHELGHHLGGFPFFGDNDWAAVEGQADYFATEACAKNIWKNDTAGNLKAAQSVDAYAKDQCDLSWSTENQRDICYRTASAGASLANLFYALDQESGSNGPRPAFNTPDPTQVSSTDWDHPASQCRLDTYFEGALCSAAFDASKIPGRNNPSGQMSLDAERDASTVSCMHVSGYNTGLRPQCWFAPRM